MSYALNIAIPLYPSLAFSFTADSCFRTFALLGSSRRPSRRSGPFWTPFRTGGAAGSHRVVWPDIARGPRALSLDHSACPTAVPLNTCYVFTASTADDALVIAAVFNSTWADALVRVTADEARGGYRRINARVASTLPIPRNSSHHAASATLSRQAHEGEHGPTEDIDDAVADALGISPGARSALRRIVHHHR